MAVHGNTRHSLLLDIGSDEISWAHNMHCLELDAASIEHIFLSHWDLQTPDTLRKVVRRISRVREKPVTVDVPVYSKPHDAMGLQDLYDAGGEVSASCDESIISDDMFLISRKPFEGKENMQSLKESPSCPKSRSQEEKFPEKRFVTCKVKDKGLVIFFIGDYQSLIKICNYALNLIHGSVLYAVVGDFDVKNADGDELNIFIEELELLRPKIFLAGPSSGYRLQFEMCNRLPGTFFRCYCGTEYIL